MRLFYTINGWAGRNDFADATMRLFYVSAVPLLATTLAALLIFLPRHPRTPSRWRVALAAGLAGAACLLAMSAVDGFARRFLQTDMLSARPFVTHSVNLLVIEPNDNSFPAPEAMLAATLAVMLWAAWPGAAWPALAAALLFGFARVFCGANYPADVAAGLGLGLGLGVLSLALCRVRLALPSRDGELWAWRLRHQAVISSAAVASITLAALFSLAGTPRHAAKMRALLGTPSGADVALAAGIPRAMTGVNAQAAPNADATAALAVEVAGGVRDGRGANGGGRDADVGGSGADGSGADAPGANAAPLVRASSIHEMAAHEGEGESGAFLTRDLPAPGVTNMGGYSPQAEAALLKTLRAASLRHRLVSVDVAQVRAGNSPFRCAAVRFEVARSGPVERRRVAQTAARIVQRAFAADDKLQNIDVSGVALNDPRATPGQGAAGSAVFAPGAVPVFTASVARRDLTMLQGPRWLNAPDVDGGLWLRARSRLYINARVLPPRRKRKSR